MTPTSRICTFWSISGLKGQSDHTDDPRLSIIVKSAMVGSVVLVHFSSKNPLLR